MYLGQLSEQNDGSWCGLGPYPTATSVVHTDRWMVVRPPVGTFLMYRTQRLTVLKHLILWDVGLSTIV